MEQIARKFSRQMEGLEFLVHTGRPPRCLDHDEPEDHSSCSSVSSRLSEPFSDYAPLEAPAAPGLQGQLAKFSEPFQGSPACPLELAIPEELTLTGDQAVFAARRPSDATVIPESSYWSMLEQYSQFRLSVNENGGRGSSQQQQVAEREKALVKCAAWLQDAACHVTSQHDLQGDVDSSTPRESKKKKHVSHDHIRSMWKREKNLIIACRANTS